MSKWLFKIFIIIAGLFYLQAAFEVNTDHVKNTWGDEYDTYIHADNSSNHNFDKVDHGKDFHIITASGFRIQIPIREAEIIIPISEELHSSPPKLFIEFRSLLI
ncbi:MAG: hypothetical protein JSU07_09310 [Bacteroidetes bacterium]|nr:hypothetical protein [Bacteroidota bacterium]